MIAIIDYGMGNIHSVNKALNLFGAKTVVTNSPADILSAEKIVLPGVGAFGDAVDELQKQGLVKALLGAIKAKKPFLGICLGMQLLFEASEESKGAKGLGVIKGKVVKFKVSGKLKVPHMGWNGLSKIASACPLLKDIAEGSFVYFCHSYYPQPRDKKVTAAIADYGADFCTAVWQDNLYGVQFHPEKSQRIGLKIMENFVNLC